MTRKLLMGTAGAAIDLAAHVLKPVRLNSADRYALADTLAKAGVRRWDFRADHAYRPTPPRQRKNLRYLDMPNGEVERVTRGERKIIRRRLMRKALAAGKVSLSTPPRHANRRSERA